MKGIVISRPRVIPESEWMQFTPADFVRSVGQVVDIAGKGQYEVVSLSDDGRNVEMKPYRGRCLKYVAASMRIRNWQPSKHAGGRRAVR